METKVCTKCEEGKSVSEFGKDRSSGDGLNYYCKECARIKSKEWVDNNTERRKEIRFKSNEKYRDEINLKNRERKRKNKDACRAYNKRWYRDNKDHVRQLSYAWRDRHKEELSQRRKDRYLNDPLYKLIRIVTNSIKHSVRNRGYKKKLFFT